MDNLLFQDINENYIVSLNEASYKNILMCCTNSNSNETGGILIGKYSNDNQTAMILHATSPPRSSKFFKTKFYRSAKGLQKILDIAWERGEYYLGEWHYRPDFHPTPSSVDIKQMISLSKNKSLKCPQPILIIAGGSAQNLTLGVSIFNDSKQIFLKKI